MGIRIPEGIDADNGHGPGVFQRLVIDGFFLDLAALVAGFHGAQHAAAFGDAVEFGQNGLFHQVGEFVHDEAALLGIFIFRQAPLPVDDHLDGQGTAHRFPGGRGDGFVEGIGVQAVAVVVDGAQGLQGGTNVVELDVLAVQRAAGGLDMVFEHLRARRGAVFIPQGDRPDAARHPADHGVFGIHPVGEEKGQVRPEVVQGHAAGKIILQIGEPVGQREGQL